MKKKNIVVILIILAACALFYIMQPKKGYFNDLILGQYNAKNFTEIKIQNITDSDITEITCKDKNKINEFISYLETLKLVEANGGIYYSKSANYYIFLRNEVKNSEGQLHANENLGITVYGNNLNFIDVFNNNHTKTYKIVIGKFDMKYIQEILKTSKQTSEGTLTMTLNGKEYDGSGISAENSKYKGFSRKCYC